MAEYIERGQILGYMDLVVIHARGVAGNDSILKKVTDIVENMRDLVAEAPSADVVPVVHSHWVHDINNLYGCYRCMERETMSPKKLKPYCPNCGAHMKDGE